MKYFYWAVLCFLFLPCLIKAQNIVKISGKIQNPISDSVLITYNDNRIAYYPKEFYALVDKTGKFNIEFPVPEDVYTQAELKHGNKIAEIIVQAKDSLVLTVNTTHFDSTIAYKGRGSDIENFVAQHTLAKGRMNQYALKMKEAIPNEPADFLKTIDKERQTEITLLNQKKKNLPAYFIKYWTAYYQYYTYFFIQQYPQVHEMLKQKHYTDTIPQLNYQVIKKMPLVFNDTFLQLPPYLLYLTGAIEIQLKASGYSFYMKDTMGARKFQDSVNKLVYKKMTNKSAEFYMAQNLYGRARYQPIAQTNYQLTDFKNHWLQSQYLPLLEQQTAIAQRLAPGQPAPDIDINTNDGGTPIKLSTLKGKVVYLEFWAGWCRQCVGEMIREQKVKDLIKNKPLEFVYVSIGEDTASENAVIKKYKMTGNFITAKGGWASKEVQQYGVQALPAYFLIDEEGNFALQNPPSPMQPTQLVLEIEKLFKE